MRDGSYYRALECGLNKIETFHNLILEFGVQGGDSTAVVREIMDSHYKIFGFDCFTGLPESWICNEKEVCGKGTFDCGGNIPNIPGVKFYKGLFSETIPEYLKENGPKPISLIHMDCDLYSSCCDVLNNLTECIVKDTIIVFDEWTIWQNVNNTDGEQKAFKEWCSKHNRTWESIPFSDPISADRYILKMTN